MKTYTSQKPHEPLSEVLTIRVEKSLKEAFLERGAEWVRKAMRASIEEEQAKRESSELTI